MRAMLLQIVLKELRERRVVDVNFLSKTIGLPSSEIERILEHLIRRGVLEEVKCKECVNFVLFIPFALLRIEQIYIRLGYLN